MQKSLSPETCKAIQEILRYLVDHPEAGDTLQNIAMWWIAPERLLPKWKEVKEVEEALAYLVTQGVIAETTLPGGQKFYKAVLAQQHRITQLLQGEEVSDLYHRD